MECKQDVPECLEAYKPQIQADQPLFADDDDDEEDGEDNPASSIPMAAPGAAWDASDGSTSFQGMHRTFQDLKPVPAKGNWS